MGGVLGEELSGWGYGRSLVGGVLGRSIVSGDFREELF